jgi:hypothetical protein
VAEANRNGEPKCSARIDLGRNETGGFVLAAALAVMIAGIDQIAGWRPKRARTQRFKAIGAS